MNESQKSELTKLAQDRILLAVLEEYFEQRFHKLLEDTGNYAGTGQEDAVLGQALKAITSARNEVRNALLEIKNLGKVGQVNKDNQNPAR